MVEFPTFKGSWPRPWPGIGSYCIPSCISRWPLPTYQISLKSKKLFVDGRTDGWTDNLRPALLGRLGGVDLKNSIVKLARIAVLVADDVGRFSECQSLWMWSTKPIFLTDMLLSETLSTRLRSLSISVGFIYLFPFHSPTRPTTPQLLPATLLALSLASVFASSDQRLTDLATWYVLKVESGTWLRLR